MGGSTLERPFPAYSGDEPYVFVCYAHDDHSIVYPEIAWLRDQGVNVWYDEGIAPGTEWRAELAQAIDRAYLILYYVSSRSIASAHCDREINYGLDQELPILPIYLEPVELPKGQKIGLSRLQAVHLEDTDLESHRVRLLDLLTNGAASGVSHASHEPVEPVRNRPYRRWFSLVAGLAAVIVAGALIVNSWPSRLPGAKADPDRLAYPLPTKPSLVVLPFRNTDTHDVYDAFVDGITEDLITDLSRLSDLFLIAGTTSLKYRERDAELRQVAEELGIRYVLLGRARGSDEARRVNVQLVDSVSGELLWGRRFVVQGLDTVELHNVVVDEVAATLGLAGRAATRSNYETDNRLAHSAFLAGWREFRGNSPESFAAAIPHFETAIELDPNYGRAHAALAAVYQLSLSRDFIVGHGEWSRGVGLTHNQLLERAERHLERARSSPSPLYHYVLAHTRLYQKRFALAVDEANVAIELDSNDPLGYEALAAAHILSGEARAGKEAISRALRLDPQNQLAYLYWKGLAEFLMQDHEPARQTLERAAELNPRDDRALIVLASAYGHLGLPQGAVTIARLNEVRASRKELRSRAPQGDIREGITTFLTGPYAQTDVNVWRFKRTADREHLRKGLALAGLPAHVPESESPLSVAGATTVDVATAKALYDRGVSMVDVRTLAAWKAGHILGAVHLGILEGFSEAALLRVADRDDEVIIYCEGPKCAQSSEACGRAVSWGFTRVYYFRDGYPGWQAAGHPTDVVED